MATLPMPQTLPPAAMQRPRIPMGNDALIKGSTTIPQQQMLPQTGLIGSEQALRGGLSAALSGLQQGFGTARQDVLSILGGGSGAAMPNIRVNVPNVSFSTAGTRQAGTSALTGARSQGLDAIQQAIGQGVSGINQFVSPGVQAQQQAAALSGALGREAQQQAMSAFEESPGQAFLREQAEQSLLRNQAAIGGLGGGNVRQELQRQAIGLAAQDQQRQIENLQALAGQGLTAAGQEAQLRGQQAALESGLIGQTGLAEADLLAALSGQEAGLAGQRIGAGAQLGAAQIGAQASIARQNLANRAALAGQLANIGTTGGQLAAQLSSQTGRDLASGRMLVGEQLAQQIGGTTSALSNLAFQQGAGISDILGTSGSNLASLLAGAGQSDAEAQIQLATLLSNIATQQGSSAAGLPSIPGIQQTEGMLGDIGSLIGGIGAAFAASDIRLKENVRYLDKTPGGHNLYLWDWTDEAKEIVGDQINIGVIAQEIAETIPEAVTVGPDGFLLVDYSKVE